MREYFQKICHKQGKVILTEQRADTMLSLRDGSHSLTGKYRCGDHWHVTSQVDDPENRPNRRKTTKAKRPT